MEPEFKLSIKIRPVRPNDAEALSTIQNHYIGSTIKTIHSGILTASDFSEKIRTAIEEGYLFLVATIDNRDNVHAAAPGAADSDRGSVVGYCSASRFRSQEGWIPTGEISLFLAPGFEREGIGRRLLSTFIGTLKAAKRLWPEQDLNPDAKHVVVTVGDAAEHVRVRYVRQLIAVCVVDSDDLERYYSDFGFDRVGYFEQGGYKFGKWIDIVMLRLVI